MTARCRQGSAAARDVLPRILAFRQADRGSVATEYGLIAALVVVIVIVALTQVRTNLLALPFPALIGAFADALS